MAGVGFGLALLGVNRILIALAPPAQHAGLIAAIFIINFLGLSIPVVIAGVATVHFGLHRTALAYCAGSLMLRGRGPVAGQDATGWTCGYTDQASPQTSRSPREALADSGGPSMYLAGWRSAASTVTRRGQRDVRCCRTRRACR